MRNSLDFADYIKLHPKNELGNESNTYIGESTTCSTYKSKQQRKKLHQQTTEKQGTERSITRKFLPKPKYDERK